jgi:adenylate kinase
MHVIQFGPPNSGKGTQGTHIAQFLGLLPVVTGNFFRGFNKSEFSNGHPLFPLQVEYLEMKQKASEDRESKGLLVDDSFTNKMVKAHLEANPKKNFLFDGYPRTVNQVQFLFDTIKNFKGIVIEFDVPVDELWERAQTRGREDSDRSVFDTRMREYTDSTRLVLPYMLGAKVPYFKIDGVGIQEEVWGRTEAVLRFARDIYRNAGHKF